MSRVIYKDRLPKPGETKEYRIAQTNEVIPVRHVAHQNGVPCFWYETDDTNGYLGTLRIYCIGTGHPFEEYADYIGTLQDAPFVWHYYAAWVDSP